MTSPKLLADAQRAAIDAPVELYDFDLTSVGAGVLYVTPAPMVLDLAAPAPQAVTWRGIVYAPVPMQVEGYEATSAGALPAPRITMANVNLAIAALVISFDDLLGCLVTRHRTLRKYLDGQSAADPDVEWPPDIYRIERKAEQNEVFITFELAPQVDLQGRKIPARRMLQDACLARYRAFDGLKFNYSTSELACPFNGSTNNNRMFDAAGTEVFDPALDKPGRRIKNCCKLRFPNQPLPTLAFPGLVTT